MMDLNNNQFKLDNLSLKPARPTIPYAQFPRPTLQDPEASFENRRSSTDSEESSTSRDSLSGLSEAEEMQSGAGSRHTRRRSARRPINAADSSRHDRNGGHEEVRWSLEEDAWSEEDSKSNSDSGRYGGRSDDDGQDDEETGLTGRRGKRSQQRRDGRGLDSRIVKDSEITSEEKIEADQSVIKNMLINGMFIGLWYFTSPQTYLFNKTNSTSGTSSPSPSPSTTNGCSPKKISTSDSPSSQPACTCSFNSLSPPSSYGSSHNSAPEPIHSLTQAGHIPPKSSAGAISTMQNTNHS